MDLELLASLSTAIDDVLRQPEWRTALDSLFISMRAVFIFDNVAIFRRDPKTGSTDVIYARAIGRGKAAEADAAWGQELVAEVLSTRKRILREPGKPSGKTDRLQRPHMLGLPLIVGGRLSAALVFTRFGGPDFIAEHVHLASLIAFSAAALVNNHDLQEAYGVLDSVQRQMRLQDDFVSTVSHELRTPLGFIKGYATSLMREDTTWDTGTQREFLGIIEEESDRLTSLIDNMLQSARLQTRTAQFKFAPLRLDALIRDVATRVRANHPGVRIDFNFGTVPVMQGDSARLTQVFENLFTNAIKYAPGSPVDISMRHEGDLLHITFGDQGEGIAEEFLPFLFERFYRVPGDAGVTGTGLGLYICKQIVLAHRGKIWVESVLDRGTTFHIELPVEHDA
jgi:signal transduction histidine kinase